MPLDGDIGLYDPETAEALRIIQGMRMLLFTPYAWTKHAFYDQRYGTHCLVGAAVRVSGEGDISRLSTGDGHTAASRHVVRLMQYAVGKRGYETVGEFNDDSSTTFLKMHEILDETEALIRG